MSKPRVAWWYSPKLTRGYWRVTHRPEKPTRREIELWDAAHREVYAANLKIGEEAYERTASIQTLAR